MTKKVSPFSWRSKRRPYKKKGRQVFVTLLLILILVGIILIFLRQFYFLAALFSVFFVYWALNITEPGEVEYKVDNQGIWVGNQLYEWGRLGNFWCQEQDNYHLCYFKDYRSFLGHVILTAQDKVIINKLKQTLKLKLTEKKPEDNFVDKLIRWTQTKVDLEKTA